jgi:hypothetical protein
MSVVMGITCVLMRHPLMVPCAECYEDHCGEPGCHAVHACWPCYREYEENYLPHGGPEVCERHRPEHEAARRRRIHRIRSAYARRHR